jgi:hypothetical protein
LFMGHAPSENRPDLAWRLSANIALQNPPSLARQPLDVRVDSPLEIPLGTHSANASHANDIGTCPELFELAWPSCALVRRHSSDEKWS